MERKRKADDSPQQGNWDLEELDLWGFQDPNSIGQHNQIYQTHSHLNQHDLSGNLNGQLYQNYGSSSTSSSSSLYQQHPSQQSQHLHHQQLHHQQSQQLQQHQQQQLQQQQQVQQRQAVMSADLDNFADPNGFNSRSLQNQGFSQYPTDQTYLDNSFQQLPIAPVYGQQLLPQANDHRLHQQQQQQHQHHLAPQDYLGQHSQQQPQQLGGSAKGTATNAYLQQAQQLQQQQQHPQFSSVADPHYYGSNTQMSSSNYQYGREVDALQQHQQMQQMHQVPIFSNATISQVPEIPFHAKMSNTTSLAATVPTGKPAKTKSNPAKKQKQDTTTSLQPIIPMSSPRAVAPAQSNQLARVPSASSRGGSPLLTSMPQMSSGANTMPLMISNPLDSQAMGYRNDLLAGNFTNGHQEANEGGPGMLLAAVQRAIQNPEEEKICLILNSKVAQKSYGSEKRFFCPPPAVMLIGQSWKMNGGDPEVKIGIEEDGKDAQVGPLDADGCTVFKNLFISDSDKRKNFSLHIRIASPLGKEYGIFRSKPLKVISKPSKKKQSVKNVELSIIHGTTIALFNRIRSQTVSTKYLGVENDALVTKGSIWDAFTVTAVGKNPEPGEELNLLYGMEVILQSTLTGLTSPSLVIHKVEKSDNVVHCDEPISQLHKVALYVKGTDRSYLSATDSAVTMEKSTMSASNEESLSDTASWTIVGTDRVKYRFNDLAMPGGPITPVPVVDYVKIQSKSLVELYGENFSSGLTVWFGETPSKTRYRCEEFITCEPPLYSELHGTGGATYCTTRTELPLLLVRKDGAVFHTGHKYTYQVEPVPFSR